MSKFKVGDKVEYSGKKNQNLIGKYGVIVGIEPNGSIRVRWNDGMDRIVDESLMKKGWPRLNSCASSNPVVQNALKACNAGWAMISREGGKWYYAWADGSSNGTEGPFRSEDEATIAAKQDGFKIKNSTAANAEVAKNARTDWNQEVYNITEKVKKLVAKAKAEGATGPNSFGEIFENCLKVLRGY